MARYVCTESTPEDNGQSVVIHFLFFFPYRSAPRFFLKIHIDVVF